MILEASSSNSRFRKYYFPYSSSYFNIYIHFLKPLLQHVVVDQVTKETYRYDRMEPLILIGGFPRSGTTLARALLDAHPDVRCGEETRVVAHLLKMHSDWVASRDEIVRQEEGGVTKEVPDNN